MSRPRSHPPARSSFGHLLSPPIAVEHPWAELQVGEVWAPVVVRHEGELATLMPPVRIVVPE